MQFLNPDGSDLTPEDNDFYACLRPFEKMAMANDGPDEGSAEKDAPFIDSRPEDFGGIPNCEVDVFLAFDRDFDRALKCGDLFWNDPRKSYAATFDYPVLECSGLLTNRKG